MVEALKIQRSVVIKADQARVWKALTTPSEIAKWFQVFDFDFEPLRIGERIHMSWEPNEAVDFNETYGEVTVVEPISRFGFSWQCALPDLTSTFVVFDLETIADGTRVTVTETGWEALPEAVRQKRFDDNNGGWDDMSKSLARYVEGQA